MQKKKSIPLLSSRLKHDAVKQSPYNYQQIITLPLRLKGCFSFFKALRFQIAFKRSNQIVEASGETTLSSDQAPSDGRTQSHTLINQSPEKCYSTQTSTEDQYGKKHQYVEECLSDG